VEPNTGIITDCALTKAAGRTVDGQSTSEVATSLALLEGESEPVRVLTDSAYGSGDFRAGLVEHGRIDVVKPCARLCQAGLPSTISR
jgi:hypothetical protein